MTQQHYASRSGHLDVCALLLRSGACASPRTPGGATPLHRAAYCGHVDVVRLLLRCGADPLLRDDDGASPLHKVMPANASALTHSYYHTRKRFSIKINFINPTLGKFFYHSTFLRTHTHTGLKYMHTHTQIQAKAYPCCLVRSKFRTARQSGGYDRFLSQEFARL